MSERRKEKQTAFRFGEKTLKEIDEIIEMGEYASKTQAVEEAIAYYCEMLRIGEIPIIKGNAVILRGKLLEQVEEIKKQMGIEDDNDVLKHLIDFKHKSLSKRAIDTPQTTEGSL